MRRRRCTTAAATCSSRERCRARISPPRRCRWRRPRPQYELAASHAKALQAGGKKQQVQSAQGQLTSAQGKYEGAAAQLAYSEIRSPIDGVVTDRPSYPGETPPPGTSAADHHGHLVGDRARTHSAKRCRRAEARRRRHARRSRRISTFTAKSRWSVRRLIPTAPRLRCGSKRAIPTASCGQARR